MNKLEYLPMDYLKETKEMMRAVYSAAQSKNLEPIKDFLSGEALPYIPKDVKERVIFVETLVCLIMLNNGEELLNYLIFDYQIDQGIMDYVVTTKIDANKAHEMFKIRSSKQFALELDAELKYNRDNLNKKLKV